MTVWFSDVYVNVVFPDLLHECCAPFCLLLAAVANYFVRHSEVSNKLFQGISSVAFGLHWVYCGEVEVRGEYLGILVAFERFVLPIHSVGISHTMYSWLLVHAIRPIPPSKGQKG